MKLSEKEWRTVLYGMGARDTEVDKYIDDFMGVLPTIGVTATRKRLAFFLAQIFHESGCLRYTEENLNYSSDALCSVFSKYFPTKELADEYARQPEKIANRVYANRMGNADESSDDGWCYRGRGLIQLTGKNNYKAFADWSATKTDRYRYPDPDLVSSDYAVSSACFFWDTNSLNTCADDDDFLLLTKKINGGYNGLEHREELLAKALHYLPEALHYLPEE